MTGFFEWTLKLQNPAKGVLSVRAVNITSENITNLGLSRVKLSLEENEINLVHMLYNTRTHWQQQQQQTTSNSNNDILQRFPNECRKTKIKVITLANQKEQRQSSKPIKTRSNIT